MRTNHDYEPHFQPNWCAVDEYMPKCTARNVINDHPCIDTELRLFIKKKNNQRKIALRTGSQNYYGATQNIWSLRKRKITDAHKLRDPMHESPKRFWSFVKKNTTISVLPFFEKANIF